MFRIRPTLTAALAALALLALAAPPAAAQCPPFICYVDLVQGAAICPNGSVYQVEIGPDSGTCPVAGFSARVTVDLPANCSGLIVVTEFGSDPQDHLVNIGDSETNNGFGGDAGTLPAGQNAEVHLVDDRLLVFSAADNPDDVDTLADAHLQLNEGALKFVVDDQFVSWGNPYTALETPDLERLFFLGDNPDNRTLFVAVNRVIANTARLGCGLRHVLMFTR